MGRDKVEYRGVCKRPRGKFGAEIRHPQTKAREWLGTFGTPLEAAYAYDKRAIELYGEVDAQTNFPTLSQAYARAMAAKASLENDKHYSFLTRKRKLGASSSGKCDVSQVPHSEIEETTYGTLDTGNPNFQTGADLQGKWGIQDEYHPEASNIELTDSDIHLFNTVHYQNVYQPYHDWCNGASEVDSLNMESNENVPNRPGVLSEGSDVPGGLYSESGDVDEEEWDPCFFA